MTIFKFDEVEIIQVRYRLSLPEEMEPAPVSTAVMAQSRVPKVKDICLECEVKDRRGENYVVEPFDEEMIISKADLLVGDHRFEVYPTYPTSPYGSFKQIRAEITDGK